MISQKKLLEYHNRGSAEDKERMFKLVRLDLSQGWRFVASRSWSVSTPSGTPIIPVLNAVIESGDFAQVLAMQRKISALAHAFDAFEKHIDKISEGVR